LQQEPSKFRDTAPMAMTIPSRIRTVIAADFDNDGYDELFFNNIGQPNRLFGYRSGKWISLDTGDALEPSGLGTGAAVGDFDGDGRLELVIAHGESGAQPLSLYHTPENRHFWLRVLPLTPYGAPARGAVVTLTTAERRQTKVIDAGSGYLCQMEPVAHFGLGTNAAIESVEVRWVDGAIAKLAAPEPKQVIRVPHPGRR
jgi:ASPIC and UnbV/FG-GAP-like repeat